MPYIDKERILNESPKKQLIIGFNNLKKNFNEKNADDYSLLYKNQPLSFIIDNSRLIFSEPFYGCKFYSNIICGDTEYCIFNKYKYELTKIIDFINENQENMIPEQLKMYTDLKDRLTKKIDDYKNTIFMIDYVNSDEYSNLISEISDELYEYKKALETNDEEKDEEKIDDIRNHILNLVSKIDNSKLYFALVPYITKVTGDNSVISSNISKFQSENDDGSMETNKETIDNVVVVSKLASDKSYIEAVHNISNKIDRIIFEGLASSSVSDLLDNIITEKVNNIDTNYSTPKSAVNQLFNVNINDILYKEEYDEFKKKNYGTQLAIFENMLDMIFFEYTTCENPDDIISGYNYFKEDTKIQDALIMISECVEKATDIVSEVVYELSDDDIDEFINKEQPTAKNKANEIQFKAMDAEVQQNKKRAESKQKRQEVGNAVKAVAQLPKNIVTDIKDQIHKIDDMDDTRRKKYMSEPGFRKKAFKNLKLALLYGGAAKFSIALIPVVAICRHYSKDKDRRIRNELYKELETDIKVCDEKINDANANGDNKAKYQLIRLKSKLEAEKARVKLNSKYI